MKTLEEMPDVEKTSLFGTAVHAVFRQPQLDTAALERTLAAAGIKAQRRACISSLEDVFLDVVEKAGRESVTRVCVDPGGHRKELRQIARDRGP